MSTTDGPVFTGRPSVVGHRGLGKGTVEGHDENSLGSLLAAVDLGVDWVELDVTRTADDVLVVHHNPSTADGEWIVERTSADLAARHAMSTLDEVLDALPPQVGVDVDVKTVLEDAPLGRGAGTVGLLASVLAREVRRRRLLVTSFDVAALLWLRDQVPGLALGSIAWVDYPLRMAVTAAAHLDLDVVGVHHRSFGPNPVEHGPVHRDPSYSVDVAHAAGLEVLAWCPSGDSIATLVLAGVDAVCLNDLPETLLLVHHAAGDPPP
ncbi:MAG: glycerophosphodiester phosphodiesterase [Actinomycetes bacterium]